MKNVHYTGTLEDGSKLPSWMTFSSNDITFQGSPPPMMAYMTYRIALRADDGNGNELGSEIFNFTVASREVSMTRTTLPPINLTSNTAFSRDIQGLIQPYLLINGKAATESQYHTLNISIASDSPSWVSYSGGKLTGSVPGSNPAPILLSVRDDLAGNANVPPLTMTIPVSFGNSYFIGAIVPTLFAQKGSAFSLPLGQYLSNATGSQHFQITPTFDPKDTSWLLLDSSPPLLHGTVPLDPSENHVNVTLTAWDSGTNASSTVSMYISLLNEQASSGASSHSQKSITNHSKVVIGVVVGIIGGFALLCACMVYVKRQRRVDAESKIRRRQSTPGLKEYVIDQMVSQTGRELPEPRQFASDDLESHTDSMSMENNGRTHSPTNPANISNMGAAHGSGRLSKRDFFKPSLYHPARFLRPQVHVQEAPLTRKHSGGSSFLSTMQNSLRGLRRSRDRPEISKPLPYAGDSKSSLKSGESNEKISGGKSSSRTLDKNAPPIPSRSVHSFAAPYSTSQVSAMPPPMPSQFTDESSLEGGVSVHEGRGLADDTSHMWVHRQHSGGLQSTPPAGPSSGQGLARRPSDPKEEAVVSRAYMGNVKQQRTSEPRAVRWNSLNSALEDPSLYINGNAFQSSTTGYTNSSNGGDGSGSAASHSAPRAAAVVQNRNVRRAQPELRDGEHMRNVSDRGEVANAVMKNPKAAVSSHAIQQVVQRDGTNDWFY